MIRIPNIPFSKRLLIPTLLLVFTLLFVGGILSLKAQAQYDDSYDDEEVMDPVMIILIISVYAIPIIINLIIMRFLYKDAEQRGKSGIVWLIFGLFCGPLACFIWLLVRPPILPPGVQPGMPPPGFAPPPPWGPYGGQPPPPPPKAPPGY